MKHCKRIEIVIEEPMAPRLVAILRDIGVSAYTAIHDASGDGDRGIRRADELVGDTSNAVFIIACEDEALVEKIAEAVRPMLRRSGGLCLVSDALSLIH